MGYIPPVRDDQVVQYGNRYIHRKHSIQATSPVNKSEFFEGLKKRKEKLISYDKDQVIVTKGMEGKKNQVYRELTGKGYFIDEVV